MSVLKIKKTDGNWYTVEGSFTSTIVQSLPQVGTPGVLYLTPVGNVYSAHLWKEVSGTYQWCTFGGGGGSSTVTDVQIDGTSIVINGIANIPLGNYSTTDQMNTAISAYHDTTKQDTINDLTTIRNGASAGATALQSGNNISLLTNDSGYITNAAISGKEDTSNKVSTITSQSTNTQYPGAKAVYDGLEEIREIAEGKSKNYSVSIETNPSFNTQDQSITITSFTDINGNIIAPSDVKVGDNVYTTSLTVPDRWIAATTTTNMTLYRLETAKVPVTDVQVNGTSVVSNHVANVVISGKQDTIDSSHKLASDLVDDTNQTNKFVTSNDKTTWNNKLTPNATITGATKTKITYDSKGLVTAGADLTASDIPSLNASKITDGQFSDARIASAATWNNKQNAITSSNKLNADLLSDGSTNKPSVWNSKQNAITSSNKLSADLLSDGSTNKPSVWNNKQSALTINPSGATTPLTSLGINGTNYKLANDQVQSNWTETTSTEPSYIQNKPSVENITFQKGGNTVGTIGVYGPSQAQTINIKDEITIAATQPTDPDNQIWLDTTTTQPQSWQDVIGLAQSSTAGLIKASPKTSAMTTEVCIDSSTGKLYIAPGGGNVINDSTTSLGTTWSSSKIDTLVGNIESVLITIRGV